MKRSINWKFLGILLAAMAVVGAGVHFLHGYQVRRNSGAFLELAHKEKQDNPQKAIDYLFRYLHFEPKDTDARAELGILLQEQGTKLRSFKTLAGAYFAYDQVLREDEARDDIRERLVEVAISIARREDARANLSVLMKKSDAAKFKMLMAVCDEKEKQYAKAADWYKKAAEAAKDAKDPEYYKCYVQWARLYRSPLENASKADTIMDAMVDADPESAPARKHRAGYLLTHYAKDQKRLAQVEEDLAKALKLAPSDPELVHLSGRLADEKGDTPKARQILADGIALHPKSEGMYLTLAEIELREQHLDDALVVIRQGYAENAESARLALWLADLLLKKGDLKEAEATLERVRDRRGDPLLVGMLQARLHIQRNEWSKAEPLLVALTSQAADELILKEAQQSLALCYEQLGNPDLALQTYKEALKLNPASVAARVGLVRVYNAAGRIDEALHECRQLTALPTAPAEAELMRVRLLLSRNLRQPAKNRNWGEVQTALEKARKVLPKAADIPVLQAEIWLLDDAKNKDKAALMLKDVREKNPQSARLWAAEATLLAREKLEDGLKLLEQAAAQPKLDDRPLITLTRIQLTSLLPMEQARAKLADLERSSAAEPQRSRFAEQLIRGYARVGDDAAVARLLEGLAGEQPHNLAVRMALFDLATKDKNEKSQRLWLDQIHEIEGDQGILWRMAEAIVIVNRARPQDDATAVITDSFPTARKLLEEVEKKRPSWYMVHALQAEMLDLERSGQALNEYQRAFDLGDRRPALVSRLVQLHAKSGQHDKVEKIIRALLSQQDTLLSAGLGKAASHAILGEDTNLALELALRSVSAKSEKYTDHLWLGQMMRALGKESDAEKALRRARDIGAKEPETWIALVFFLNAANRPKEAEQEIAAAAGAVPEEKRDLCLAACYEGIGKMEDAEKHFLAALALKPRDWQANRNVASFYLRRQADAKAEPYLQKIMHSLPGTPVEAIAGARRDLAFLLARHGTEDFNKGVNLIKSNLELYKNDRADQRALAALFATRPHYRKEAIRLYQDLERTQTLEPQELFTLARLYDEEDHWERAEMVLSILLNSDRGHDPAHIRYYALRLLSRGDNARAAVWTDKFAKLRPDSLQLAELRATLLRSKGKHDEAVALFMPFSQKKDADVGAIARILHRMAAGAQEPEVYRRKAEELYRLNVERTKSQASLLALGNFLAEQNRFAQGLDVLERAFATGDPEPAAALSVGVLRLHNVPAEHYARVDRWLQDAARKNPKSFGLQSAIAELYDLQGKYGEAIAIYQRLQDSGQSDSIVLNNLAWLRTFHEKQPSEGLKLIDRALEDAGPDASLLDTRGVILFKLGKTKEAIEELGRALTIQSSPGIHFHLAQARLGPDPAAASDADRRAAREAFNRAQASGLSDNALHALERDAYREMKDRFKN